MKKIRLRLCMLFAILLTTSQLIAQIAVTGTVTDSDFGDPLPGVNVVVTGTTQGTVTDIDGKFNINVPSEESELTFTYVGMQSQTKIVGEQRIMDITLGTGELLDEVVVTALGIKREEKALGYSVGVVKGEEMTKARESNVINALAGKVAGVQITNSSGAVGSSSRITLRGVSTASGNSQPLFVVDGIPVDNSNFGNAGSGGGFDQPNGIADINPDDIESMTVLKGITASAIYGQRASNGVIVITTKKGVAGKGQKFGISFNSSTTFERPLILPDFQNSYGQGSSQDYFEFVDGTNGDGGTDESWGPPLDAGLEFVQWQSYKEDGVYDGSGQPLPWVSQPNNIRDFYNTGISTSNNLSFTGGAENIGYRLSGGYVNQTGMVPNTDLTKYSVSGSSNLTMKDRIHTNLSVNYIRTESDNLVTQGYNNENPVQQMIWSGRQVDFTALEDYENLPLSPEGTAAEGTPLNWNTVFQNNPYWVLNNNLNQIDKDRLIGSFGVKVDLMDDLFVSVKTGSDVTASLTKVRKAKGSNEFSEGRYYEVNRKIHENNSEALLGYNKKFSDNFDLGIKLGGNRMSRTYNQIYAEAGQLELPGVYNLSNNKSGSPLVLTNFIRENKINSLFGIANIGIGNFLYVDLTARNDWSSVLPAESNSYFYPSVNVSLVLSDLLDLNQNTFSFLKLRGGWSRVGGDGSTLPYSLDNVYGFRDSNWDGTSLLFNPANLNNPAITPEFTEGVEVGADIKLFNNRVRAEATYYNQNSTDVIVDQQISAASGFTSVKNNVGEFNNSGIELGLGATIVDNKNFSIDFDLNFAKNDNEVISLGGLDALVLGGQWNVDLQAREGFAYGVLWGPRYVKDDEGNIVHRDGLPQIDDEFGYLGDIQADFQGGANLAISVGPFEISSLVDFKKGGSIYSMTTTWGRFAGVLNETLIGREGGIVGNGVMQVGTNDDGSPIYETNNIVVSAETYNKVAFSNDVAEGSVFDASYVKWRQALVSYNFPSGFLGDKVGGSISLVGRNLAVLFRNIPHIDPESAFSSSDSEQGQEFGQLPSARSIGFNLNLKF